MRGILLHPKVRPIFAGILAVRFLPAVRCVDQPFRFFARLFGRPGIGVYRLRGSGEPLVVLHGGGSLEVVAEIFWHGYYDPPPDVAIRIPATPKILDVGANVGAYCALARTWWPDAEITAIEADPKNVVALEKFVELDGSGRIEVIAAAAATSDAPVRFGGGRGAGSMIDEHGEEVPGIDLLELLPGYDLAKIDIERSEWPILADPRLAEGGPLVIVMEYHPRFPFDVEALPEAIRLLELAGFTVGHVQPNYRGHGMLWAWRDDPASMHVDPASAAVG